MLTPQDIVFAQINPTVGDIASNLARIRDARASAMNARLVVFPELAICGYPPEDLVLRPAFVQSCMEALRTLAQDTQGSGPAIIVGGVWEEEEYIFNAAFLLAEGKIRHIQPKRMLPNYGVFDEKRIFAAGQSSSVVKLGDATLGLLICEDMWYESVARDLGRAGATLLVAINASPFESGKLVHRHEVAAVAVAAANAPLVYVNMCGAQDELVFDGGSFFMNADGVVLHQMPEFFQCVASPAAYEVTPPMKHEESVWNALVLGLRDYVQKNNFPGVVLGLSGGIDSAVAATIAVDALGPDAVLGVLLPSPYTSAESNDDAQELAKSLGIRAERAGIAQPMEAVGAALEGAMAALAPTRTDWRESLVVGGNIQARLRGLSLMAISNATGYMLLNTSNKSELAVGYSTLYGDSCGGYSALKDVYKTEVYALAKWRNRIRRVIPYNSITRPPSAELAPGQKDEDQLPPYAVLDAILARLVEGGQSVNQIVASGFDAAVVEKIARMVRISEYKRKQFAPGAKVSPMLFGRDWRYPLTNKYDGR